MVFASPVFLFIFLCVFLFQILCLFRFRDRLLLCFLDGSSFRLHCLLLYAARLCVSLFRKNRRQNRPHSHNCGNHGAYRPLLHILSLNHLVSSFSI